MSKRFRDRKDGIRVRISGFDKFLYLLKPRRSEAEVYISKKIDVSDLVKYMEKKKKDNEEITYFHLFSTAVAKLVYNKPYLNRFIMGSNKYERNEVTLSFVAKTKFEDDAKELLKVIKIEDDDNVDTISKKIFGSVRKIRSNEISHTDDFVNSLGKLPGVVMSIIVWFVKKLDRFDLLPKSLTENSIYHSSVLISNLGSIHCDGIYHNLTNFGTNSILLTIGEIKEEACVIDGKIDKRYICDFGITLDERIADGVYFAKSLNLLEYILNNPSMLEDRASDKISID
jgi:hypothetical protein